MNAVELFNEMQRRNIEISFVDGHLQCSAPKGAVTSEIRQALTVHKAAIVAILSHNIEDTPLEVHAASRSAPLPLSFAQQRLWFLDQLQPGDAAYNIPAALRVIGDFDTLAFAFAVNEIVRRHDVLRTAFVLRDGAATQVIAPRLEIETPIIDLGALDEQMRETEALRLAAEEARRPFDLATGPLLRVKTLDLGVRPATAERERVMLFTMHHIVSDGWSSGVLLREFVALYEARLAGRPSPLPELAIQYADYAVWQRDWLRGEVLDRQLAYWRDKLGGAPPALDLPTDHPRPPRQDHAGARLSFTIAKHVADRLAALGREEGATLFMTLLAAFQLLLSRYSGQRDISVGAPVANRRRLELEQLIGFFVNTLVMRTDLSGDPSFRVLLARVRETALGAQAHQDLPFERLVEDLRPVRDMSRDPLFQVMFSLQNAPKTAAAVSGLRFEPLAAEGTSAKFDLTLSIAETDNGLAASLEYATALFEASTIDRMARHYCALLDGIARDPDRRIGELDILPQDERHRLLVEWNDTATDDPQDRLLHEMFEAQAARDPEAVALVYEGAQLSYGELNERANRLAHHLQTLGVGPDVIVGLCVERSFEMIVALLGVLKAGGAYLPIDPDYPRDRIAYMIADAAPALVLTQEHLRERLPETITTLRLDADWSVVAQESAANPAPRATSQNLAYVIYTSGSTGRPKGVGVTHRGTPNLAYVQRDRLGTHTEPGVAIRECHFRRLRLGGSYGPWRLERASS
ncbi:Linear+gramicidin+synthase+subunit+B [Methylocapsa aurea]